MTDRYIDVADAVCPTCAASRDNSESISLIGNCTYECDCGCVFEFYDKDSIYVLRSGGKAAKQGRVSSPANKEPNNITVVISGIVLLALFVVFFICFVAWSIKW